MEEQTPGLFQFLYEKPKEYEEVDLKKITEGILKHYFQKVPKEKRFFFITLYCPFRKKIVQMKSNNLSKEDHKTIQHYLQW